MTHESAPVAADLERPGLPDPLPPSPMPLLAQWLEEATEQAVTPNPNAMALATVSADGQPSVRQVLCKSMDHEAGSLVFYTNLQSPKSRDLQANPRCEVCFFWDPLQRQARVRGVAVRTTPEEDDAYFATRPLLSKLGAWASRQSQPLDGRMTLLRTLRDAAAKLHVPLEALDSAKALQAAASVVIPRPLHWGGWRIWAFRVELWVGMPGRLHDRACWERSCDLAADPPVQGPWRSARLQP